MTSEEALENIRTSSKATGDYWEGWERCYQQLYGLTRSIRKAEEKGFAPTELLQRMEEATRLIKDFKDSII